MSSTIIASLLVLLSSIGLGLGMGWFAFTLGSESLKGVKSPVENPTQKIKEQEGKEGLDLSKKKKFEIKSEKAIIVNAYDHVHGKKEANKEKK